MKTQSYKFLEKSNKFKNYPGEFSRKCYKEPIPSQSSDRQASFSSLLFEFCRKSSLHGLQFVGNPRIHKESDAISSSDSGLDSGAPLIILPV